MSVPLTADRIALLDGCARLTRPAMALNVLAYSQLPGAADAHRLKLPCPLGAA